MKRVFPRVWMLAVAAVIGLDGCGRSTPPVLECGTPTMGGGRGRLTGLGMRGRNGMMMRGSMQRHHLAMMVGSLPEDYRELRNPLPPSTAVIAQGKALYQTNCVPCHGDLGARDGPAAAGMLPPPADLQWLVRRPMAGDGYLMWSISEGGIALGSAMPAYKDVIGESDRWRFIHYLRTL